MLTDTHCHLSFKGFEEDFRVVTQRSVDAGMRMITIGTQLPTSEGAVALAHEFSNVWAAIAVHPIHVARHKFPAERYAELVRDPKVVAIGECGLDYFHLEQHYTDALEDETIGGTGHSADELKAMQRELFAKHVALAKAVNKPLIIHCREAYEDLLSAYDELAPGHPGVLHCYTGDWATAQKFLQRGLHIGFTGIITFPKSEAIQEVVKNMPLDRILIETDAPYLAPIPFRGKRNEPLYVEHVARKIAELRGISYEEVVDATSANAARLFNLGRDSMGI